MFNLQRGHMQSYKQWKLMNESILPSFNLGLGRPSNLGITSQFGFDEGMHKKKKKKMKGEDTDLVEPAEEKDKPKVDVEVEEKDHKPHKGKKHHKHKKEECEKCGAMAGKNSKGKCEKCGAMAGKYSKEECEKCGAMAGKYSKGKCKACKMEEAENDWMNRLSEESDLEDEDMMSHHDKYEDDDEEGHDHDEEDHDHDEVDIEIEGGDDEDHDHDHDEDEDLPRMEAKMHKKKKMCGDAGEKAAEEAMKMKKMKKMLKGGQKKLDVSGPHGKPDGKITGHDFAELRKRKGHGKKHQGKNEKVKSEDVAWWNSVNSMLEGGNPSQKFSSGCEGLFTTIDQDNLHVSLRNEADAD